MSQSSGLLSEDEIKNYLQESFNLKLDRDALIKPTKDVVIDVYTRFLDDTNFKWRKSKNAHDDNEESNIKALMVGWIRFMLSHYNTSYTFHMGDLITPTRKRTTAFLNVLIFIKAQFEDHWSEWERWKNEWTAQQEEVDKLKKELHSRRLELEELAIKKSSSKSVDELRKYNEEQIIIFKNIQKEAEELGEKAKIIKANIKTLSELIARKSAQGDHLDKEIAQLDRSLQLLNDNRNIKRVISDMEKSIQNGTNQLEKSKENSQKAKKKIIEVERLMSVCQMNNNNLATEVESTNRLFMKLKEEKDAIEARFEQVNNDLLKLKTEEASLQEQLAEVERNKSKKKLQVKIKEEQIMLDLEQKIALRKEFVQQSLAKSEALRAEVELIKKERAEIMTKQTTTSDNCQAQVDKANRQLESLTKRYQESRKVCEGGIVALQTYKSRLESLIGQPKDVELPGNRTYIKESADTH